ncbi:vanadium-dependent haloperoxidase [Mucilaginibacter sp. BJC16-A38]|uniref:vanadium-dependent haloperoxidase n=1 Tax=Mucilaginibacter phenanthrenivorans TaxID=1234842 RepID=UPI002158623D|nr:vanadium-dependent haloperoxidase [Mucilaginibacter phenanthrenivorans]MCR8560635.1 vanadium-dependent haloperoxidase [Mucilaginibacter phenanthrenivorans]
MNKALLITTLIGTGILSIDSTFAQQKPIDPIVQWNLITVKATKIAKQNSNLGSRTEAIEAIAVYDAVNSIKHIGTPYHYNKSVSGSASATAAAVQAAHDVLTGLFPAQKPSLDSALANSLQGITDGPVDKGQAIGAASAADILALRANDGSSPLTTYAGIEKPGVGAYRPTPGKFAPGIDVEWGNVKPFLLKDSKQFLPAPPPAIGSDDYKKALTEVNELGEIKSTKRTEDQTHIAQFYKQDAELTVNEGARLLAVAHGTSLEDNALIFALVDIAEADARIEVWGGKYKYLAWRPVTALNAEEDGSVKAYTKWTPLITTPAHPSFPSGHSATVTAGYEILKKFYGDKNHLELHTTTDGEPVRVVESLSQVEFENGYSRVYGGIHYNFENSSAQDIGRKVAGWVLAKGPRKK